MVEVTLSLLIGFLLGLPVGAFALVGWVNRYTKRQAENAQQSLEKLHGIVTKLSEHQGRPAGVN